MKVIPSIHALGDNNTAPQQTETKAEPKEGSRLFIAQLSFDTTVSNGPSI
jgi:hypothetical protein